MTIPLSTLRTTAAALGLACLVSCTQTAGGPNGAAKPGHTAPLPNVDALLSIASEAVDTHDSWGPRTRYSHPQPRKDGSWEIVATRKPAVPGGQRLIVIDAKGRVIKYQSGK